MKKLYLLFILLIAFSYGCERTYDAPAPFKPVVMTPNTTIAELKALYTGGATTIMTDALIGGKVVSTDQYGNFYRSFYIEDQTSGIEIKIGKSALYNTYKEGQTIYVKAKHLVLGSYGGTLSLGAPDPDGGTRYQNSYIDAPLWINLTILRGVFGTPATPKPINNFSEIVPLTYGTLVTLKNMKYTPPANTITTWALFGQSTAGGNAQNQTFTFPDGTNTMVVRTSNFAKFAADPVPPAGSTCNLTGVLTVYNNALQLVLNSIDGVNVIQ